MKNLILFDVDGTIAESSQKVSQETAMVLQHLHETGYELGIVGGSKYEKIKEQLELLPNDVITHVFSENGCVYHKNDVLLFKKNIRDHPLYPQINILIKKSLEYLAQVPYTVTGQFIDLRNGIIYISLIGSQANLQERKYFIELDKVHHYRKALLKILKDLAITLGISEQIDILEGGSVGIGIHPIEWDKVQVASYIKENANYDSVIYFGDKWLTDGNDYRLLHHPSVTGHKTNSVRETLETIETLYLSR